MIDEKSKEFQFADDMLLKVSRTFALNINVLSGRLKQSVLLAYLCLRIADTVEDDPQMTASEKKRLLDAFSNIFANYDKHLVKEFTDALPVEWSESKDPNHILCRETATIVSLCTQLPQKHKGAISAVVIEMSFGMAKFAQKQEHDLKTGWFTIDSVAELDEYCYFVAGIVGKLLTQLFCEESRFLKDKDAKTLRSLEISFGLALQITNIIKDIQEDAKRKVCFIPNDLLKEHGLEYSWQLFEKDASLEVQSSVVKALIQKAWRHLDDAIQYVLTLPRLDRRIRLFCLWPLFMAVENLRIMKDGALVFESKDKLKISRNTVKKIVRSTSVLYFSNFWIQRKYSRLRNS